MQINKSSYSGGKFVYKKWGVKDGARAANRCKRNQKPDLQSTYLYNPDDSEVLRYVRIDVDAKYTSFYFKDENGAVSWPKIAQEIKEKCPDLLKHVEYVTLSQSKQGLHILIGIGPLPLNDKTIKAQLLARKIQSNIISVFNELGIGADPAGKGLKQDFSTYRNSKNTIHHNQILTRKIEHEAKLRSYVDEQGNNVIPIQRRPRLNELHQILEETMKDLGIKNMYRLYNDLRVERPIARLYLYMMGIHDKNLKLEVPSYPAWENQLELSIEDIELITGTDRRNFSNFIKTEDFKKLFIIYKVSGLFESSRYRFSIIQTSTVHKRCDRARQVLSISSNSIKFNLITPELVGDGCINSSIVSWVLALKWAGVSQELAMLKIQSLVKQIEGYDKSRACKKSQIKATVSSVYRNRCDTYGSRMGEALPEWLDVSNIKMLRSNTNSNSSLTKTSSRSSIGSTRYTAVSSKFPLDVHIISFIQGPPRNIENRDQSIIVDNKIRSVTFNKRVGFFVDDQMILCIIKNRHYMFSKIIEYIQINILKTRNKINVLTDVVHVRRNTKAYDSLAKNLYADGVVAIKSQYICGYKKKYAESLEEYKLKKNVISFKEHLKAHDDCNFEYEENMFLQNLEVGLL